MAPLRLFFLVAFFCLVEAAWFKRRKGKIYDPLGVFCGEENCYDVLNVTSTFEPQELKTKFRRLSRTYHPDKNKAENATQIFRTIAKAYEVLGNNKSRDSFDYYLRTKDYYTVAGEYVRSMPLPKPPPLAILVVVLILMSIFLHVVQNNKNARAKRILRDRVLNAKDEYNGGTKQTLAVFATAKELYLEQLEAKVAGVAAGGTDAAAASKKERKLAEKKMKKNGGTVQVPLPKLLADPAFQQIAINVRIRERRDIPLICILTNPFISISPLPPTAHRRTCYRGRLRQARAERSAHLQSPQVAILSLPIPLKVLPAPHLQRAAFSRGEIRDDHRGRGACHMGRPNTHPANRARRTPSVETKRVRQIYSRTSAKSAPAKKMDQGG